MPYPFPWSPVICECSWKKTQIEKQNKYCLPFYPPSNPKSQNSLEILSFYTCTTNDNHMMYGFWNMERDRQKFCYFRPFFTFSPPPPPSPLPLPSNKPKNQKKKLKWKKHLKISSFCTSVPNKLITWCAVLEIWFVMNRQMDGLTEGRSDM